MELNRSIYSKLESWKSTSKGKTGLLIEGARRVGKSTVVKNFAKKHYRSHIFIDFAIAPKSIRDNFLDNLSNLDRFFQTLSIEYGTQLFERDSLIVFDEVQMFPQARQT